MNLLRQLIFMLLVKFSKLCLAKFWANNICSSITIMIRQIFWQHFDVDFLTSVLTGSNLEKSALTSVTRLAIFCTLGNFSKPVATIIVPKLSTFRAIFCKGVNISHFSNEIIFGQLLQTFGNLILVTLQLQQPVFTSFCVNGDSNGGGLRSRWWGQANMTANHIIWENKLNLRRIGFK